jgi:hypothetical protein
MVRDPLLFTCSPFLPYVHILSTRNSNQIVDVSIIR